MRKYIWLKLLLLLVQVKVLDMLLLNAFIKMVLKSVSLIIILKQPMLLLQNSQMVMLLLLLQMFQNVTRSSMPSTKLLGILEIYMLSSIMLVLLLQLPLIPLRRINSSIHSLSMSVVQFGVAKQHINTLKNLVMVVK